MKSRDLYIIVSVGAVTVGVVTYFFGAKIFNALKDVNKGTPYEGAGAVGTLGNATNSLLGGAPQAIGEQIASWLSSDDTGENVYYVVLFPKGDKHAVPATSVGSEGYFQYDGKRYRLGVNQASQKVAVAA